MEEWSRGSKAAWDVSFEVDLTAHFHILARYNRIANERLFESCAQLDIAEYRKQQPGSFGSIHGLLNHLLLADRIWMARFEGSAHTTTPILNTVLFDDFAALRSARIEQDARIEMFFASLDGGFLARSFSYTNN